jgi:transcriptional regulator with XRE-family HTH domain
VGLVWLDSMDGDGRGICQPAKGPLGRALRELRHDLWLSQERLGALAGVSQTAVSRLELGRGSWPLFCRLVQAVGGYPVVTIERIPTPREVADAYLNDADPYPKGWAPEPEAAGDGWW